MKAEEVKTHVLAAIEKYPKEVEEYKKGKVGLIGLFLGEVMKTTKNEADPKSATEIIKTIITNY